MGKDDSMTRQPVTTASTSVHDGEYVPTWADSEKVLETAEMYWITSLDNGEPHTVPVIGVWWEGALYSCNPRSERHYKNLKENSVCQALTGCSTLSEGLDVVVHGRVEEMTELDDRMRFGRQLTEKYPEPWRFEGAEEDMWVYRLVPTHARAFHRSNPISYARWDFE
jgi:nitroimidazol reductase NimA-like FMN-containing flavoprotein (pyridoxamine 5'-phosphate oxidase superfamily)